MAQVASKMTLKQLIDKNANKVLFAEAGKEAVDFICGILTIPVGTVTRLLSEEGMVGSLSNLYRSIENLNDDYGQPEKHKDTVLKPKVCDATEETPLFMLSNEPNKKPETIIFYKCNRIPAVTNVYVTICSSCKNVMQSKVRFVDGITTPVPISCKGGFVKGAVTYMVISPTSAVNCISFLNNLNIDMRSIEEKVVDLDVAKACLSV